MTTPDAPQENTYMDAGKRAIRTFVQAFIGVLLVGWMGLNLAPGELPDWDIAKRLLIAATVAGVIAVVTWLQNTFEASTGKALLPK